MHPVILRDLTAEHIKDITTMVDGVQRARRSPRHRNFPPWRAFAGPARARVPGSPVTRTPRRKDAIAVINGRTLNMAAVVNTAISEEQR